jgi:hypothetical protein
LVAAGEVADQERAFRERLANAGVEVAALWPMPAPLWIGLVEMDRAGNVPGLVDWLKELAEQHESRNLGLDKLK